MIFDGEKAYALRGRQGASLVLRRLWRRCRPVINRQRNAPSSHAGNDCGGAGRGVRAGLASERLTAARRVPHVCRMRANYTLKRLFVTDDLAAGAAFDLAAEQSHYLANVLRMAEGAELLVFNGRDGEWLARVAARTKKAVRLEAVEADAAAAGAVRPRLLLRAAEGRAARLSRAEGGRDGRRRAAAGDDPAHAAGQGRASSGCAPM